MDNITGKRIKKEFGDRVLFEINDIHLAMGEKVGLVGANGQGKSTLLRMLIGEEEEFSGNLSVDVTWAYVPQLKETAPNQAGNRFYLLSRKPWHKKLRY